MLVAGTALTADEVIDGVIAPIVYRVIFQPWTLTDDTAPTLVARLRPIPRRVAC